MQDAKDKVLEDLMNMLDERTASRFQSSGDAAPLAEAMPDGDDEPDDDDDDSYSISGRKSKVAEGDVMGDKPSLERQVDEILEAEDDPAVALKKIKALLTGGPVVEKSVKVVVGSDDPLSKLRDALGGA